MKRNVFGSAAAVLCAGALAAAQSPATTTTQQAPQPQGAAQAESRAAAQQSTTLTGCVYREEDVPGRSPNLAERVGILEDYILAEVRMSPAAGASSGAIGTSGAAGAEQAGAAGAEGATATTGSNTSAAGESGMYKLEFVGDDKLQALVGKRVEVMGQIDREPGDTAARPSGTTGAGGGAEARAPGAGAPGADAAEGQPAGQAADRSLGPDRIELPEFEVASIREIAGTCPATPSGR